MRQTLRTLPALLAFGLLACSDSTAPGGTGYAAGTVDGRAWQADTALALLQDSTLVIGAIRHTPRSRVDGFTAVVHGFRLPLSVELAGAGSPAYAMFTDGPAGGSFLEPGPTQVTDSLHRGLLTLSAITAADSLLSGSISFRTAPRFGPSRSVTVRFRMRLIVADSPGAAPRIRVLLGVPAVPLALGR